MNLTSKLKKVKILVHCLDAYRCMINKVKQKQICRRTCDKRKKKKIT